MSQLVPKRTGEVLTLGATAEDEEIGPPPASVRLIILTGVIVAAILFGGFGAWAALAPLRSGIVGVGVIAVLGDHRVVQHLEGGIVREILVKEGDFVEEGQVLFRLDSTRARASIEILNGRMASAMALDARLQAEQEGASEVKLPENVRKFLDGKSELLEATDLQFQVFRARKASIEGQIAILDDRVAQLEEEKNGRAAEIESARTQTQLISEELADIEVLYEKGLARKSRLLELQRVKAQLAGVIGRGEALIAEAQQRIGQAEEEKLQLRRTQITEVSNLRQEAQDRIYDVRQRLDAQQDQFDRLEIVAPASGYVFGLKFNTPGSVVAEGDMLTQIVPRDAPLVVKATVKTQDIENVSIGSEARVRLSAFSFRSTPAIDGVVTAVSADRIVDQTGGREYFLVDIDLDKHMLESLVNVELTAGMPADVIISTGERTLMDYLMTPVLAGLERAMLE
jgi:HlyD family type I secretion membrane fusion protein